MKKNSIGFILGILISASLSAQTASFNMPDTACVDAPVTITNTSSGATTSYWNFCAANANAAPQVSSLGNPGGLLSIPVYIDYAFENGNYYGFLVNNSPGGLVRLDFGNDLRNTPTAVYLGNFGGIISNSAQGIQLVKNNGAWYAIIVTGDPETFPPTASRILKLNFGTSLTNTAPAATNWGNIGAMDYPTDLYLFQDAASKWYGLTVNYRNSTITRFSFGADFTNPPTGVNLGNLGNLRGPTGMYPINDNGVWRVFITNFDNNTLSRIDFGNSLPNAPTNAVNLGNPGNAFNNPRDLYIFNFCDQYVGYLANNNGTLARLNFTTLTSTPSVTSLGSINVSNNIHSISKMFRSGNDLFAFMPGSYSNNLSRLQFAGCTNSSIPGSSSVNPGTVSYSAPGIYNVNLTIDDGLPTQATVCRQLIVVAPAKASVSADTSICLGDSAQLIASGAQTYTWSPSSGLSNTTINNPKSSPASATSYNVTATDSHSCVQQLSVKVSIAPAPVVSVTKSGDVDCSKNPVQLTAAGGVQYQWSPASGLSSTTIANPTALPTQSTTYSVTTAALNGCKATDTIRVLVLDDVSTKLYLMPSAFTPNRDNLNDCFGLSKWGALTSVQFYVYNRWGQVIFFTTDPSKCWDGNFKGLPQPSGTYVYMIKATTACSTIDRHGTFQLIR